MAADIREWTDTDIDPVTRREIFQAGGMGSLWNVALHEIQHLGATGLYNINGSASAFGKFVADGTEHYNSYLLDNPNITNAESLAFSESYGFSTNGKVEFSSSHNQLI